MFAKALGGGGAGGLSINTGAANAFGAPATTQSATGSLFGNPAATTANAKPSLFGSAPAATQTGGGLFGAASQPQQSGGLFGAATTTPAQPAGGLFGTAAAAQPQSTGLFGNAAATTTQPKAGGLFGQTQSGGLFGQATPAAATQPAQPTASLFGQATATPPQQTNSLFGQAAAQPQAQATSLFGKPAATAPTGGLFGASASAPSASTNTLGGGFLKLGQSTSSPSANMVPGVQIDMSNIKSTTRFNDLQTDLQNQIAHIDKVIQTCIKQKNDIDAFLPGHGEQIAAIPGDATFVTRKSQGAQSALDTDVEAISSLRSMVKADADEASKCFKALNNLELPASYHTVGLFSSTRRRGDGATGAAAGSNRSAVDDGQGNPDLIDFFSKTVEEMEGQTKKFERNVREIEAHLGGIQSRFADQVQRLRSSGGGSGAQEDRVGELVAVLRDFEEGIVQVAEVVGGARAGVTELQMGEMRGRSNGLY